MIRAAEHRKIARHEAGHAVAAFLLGVPLDHVTAGPAGNWFELGAHVNASPELVMVYQAGPIVEPVVENPHEWKGYWDRHGDWRQTRRLVIELLATERGRVEKEEVRTRFRELYERTRALMAAPPAPELVELLAAELDERGTLTGEEVACLLRDALRRRPGA